LSVFVNHDMIEIGVHTKGAKYKQFYYALMTLCPHLHSDIILMR
jgi:hypothetical protein